MEIRTLRASDACQAAKIWQDIFGDSDSFVKWLFANRFYPKYSVCAEDQGQLVSMIHAMPVPLRFTNKLYGGAILSGIATLPVYRGQGLMKKLMDYEMRHLKELGIQLITQTPVNPAVYHSCDQFPCTQTGHFTYQKTKSSTPPKLSKFDLDLALTAYQYFASRYSGIVWRDKALMQLKTDDYLSDRIQPYMLKSGAYCFACVHDNGTAVCQEFAYFQEQEVPMLLEAIPAHTITGRLPADYTNTKRFQQWQQQKHAVLYPLDPEITAHLPSELSLGRQMELLCQKLDCFIWEEY